MLPNRKGEEVVSRASLLPVSSRFAFHQCPVADAAVDGGHHCRSREERRMGSSHMEGETRQRRVSSLSPQAFMSLSSEFVRNSRRHRLGLTEREELTVLDVGTAACEKEGLVRCHRAVVPPPELFATTLLAGCHH
ncbi:uncharacterized protein DS421_3g81360 [Arachis hypogaea]|nr:uncharacterized protein DS421_3g81360 [Arachis hypogaea]